MMDKTQFSESVLEIEQTLYRVAKTMLGSEADCADAVQQAILKAWENLYTLRQPQYFKTWLTRILINECTAILRQRKRRSSYEQEMDESVSAPLEQDHSDLNEALSSLDEKYRLPVILYYLECFKTREIAKMLNVPEGTVKSRLKTARGKLRKTLEGVCFA